MALSILGWYLTWHDLTAMCLSNLLCKLLPGWGLASLLVSTENGRILFTANTGGTLDPASLRYLHSHEGTWWLIQPPGRCVETALLLNEFWFKTVFWIIWIRWSMSDGCCSVFGRQDSVTQFRTQWIGLASDSKQCRLHTVSQCWQVNRESSGTLCPFSPPSLRI